MMWSKFNKELQEGINDHSSSVDPMEIWSAIEPDIDALNKKQRKKRRFLVWFLLPGVLGLGLLSFSLWHIDDTDQNLTNEAIKPSINTQATVNQEKEKEDLTEILAVETSIDDVEILSEPQVSSDQKNNPENVDSANSSVVELIRSFNAFNSRREHTEKIIENTGLISEVIPTLPTLSPLLDIPTRNNIQSHNLDQIAEIIPAVLYKPAPSSEKAITYNIGFEGGLSLSNKKMTARTADDESLVLLRESTETSLENQHLGLNVSLEHKSGFSLLTGFSHTTMVERFDYTETIDEVSMIEGVKTIYIDIDGNEIPIMGEIPQTKTTAINKKIYNRYQLFDIPVLFGYTTTWKDWKVGAQAGIFVNLSLKADGGVLEDASTIVDVEIAELYKDKLNTSYYMGLSLQRNLSPTLVLNVAPFMRVLPEEFTQPTYGVSQKYTLYGIKVGMSYRIGEY